MSSSFIPPCSPNVISRVCFIHYVMFLDSFPFTQCFPFIREVLKGSWDLRLSLNFVLNSGNALSLVANDADCLSPDRSHAHGHVRELLVNIVHTLVVDLVILCNDVLEEENMQLIAFGLMSLCLGLR